MECITLHLKELVVKQNIIEMNHDPKYKTHSSLHGNYTHVGMGVGYVAKFTLTGTVCVCTCVCV